MRKLFYFHVVLYFLVLVGCEKEPVKKELAPVTYSFFVAGHTYGEPGVNNAGLHPPFVEKFDLLKHDSLMEFGFLTGDIVVHCTNYDWNEVDQQLNQLEMPVYFAAGNHDLTNRNLYESRYGSTYYSFTHQQDLFITLDPSLDSWNISGDQLSFLDSILQYHAAAVNHVFVFFHQVLWWNQDNHYQNVALNSKNGRADTINFWSDVEPRFSSLNKPVYMFAGDVGAYPTGSECMYDNFENMTLIASGMGGGIADNFIIADVRADHSVTFRLISLNTETVDGLGKLEDYEIAD